MERVARIAADGEGRAILIDEYEIDEGTSSRRSRGLTPPQSSRPTLDSVPLLVLDEQLCRGLLIEGLRLRGYDVKTVKDFDAAGRRTPTSAPRRSHDVLVSYVAYTAIYPRSISSAYFQPTNHSRPSG